jgi:hypothetical protein
MNYYVNKNPQSNTEKEHEVHAKTNCQTFPDWNNIITLRDRSSCESALEEARQLYDDVDGCGNCNENCHTK